MQFIRALYFPRLDDSSRQSPPPRLVRLQVVLENQTWRADVKKFFNSSEIENFIIDGPYQEFGDRRKPCKICGEKQSDCSCSPLSDDLNADCRDQCKAESPETSYMMTFAAISNSDYDEEEPLLDRDCDSEPEEDCCWTRDFLFFKLDGGFPIDIGSSKPGYGNPGSSYTTMSKDVEHLQKFFVKLVPDMNLVKRRFTPGFQAEMNFEYRPSHFLQTSSSSLEEAIGSMRIGCMKTPSTSRLEELPKAKPSIASVGKTKPVNFKPNLAHRPPWVARKARNNFSAIQNLKHPILPVRSITTPISTIQQPFRVSRKYKSALHSKAPEGADCGACAGATRQSWLHFG